MRATAKILVVGMLLASGVYASQAHASVPSTLDVLLVSGLTGQVGPSLSSKRQESERLLKRARQAMDAGKFDVAEGIIEQAARLNVSYDPLVVRFVDTPDKARAELAKRRAASGAPAPGVAGGLPELPTPSAAAEADRLAPTLPGYGPARPSDSALNGSVQRNPYLVQPTPQAKQSAMQQLWEARRALSRGDIAQATDKLNRAKAAGVTYSQREDSPARVEALIGQFSQYTNGQAAGDAETQTRDYARFLMEQADGFLSHGDLKLARQMAEQAKAMRVPYGPRDRTPGQLLERIAAAQRQQPAAPPAATQNIRPTANQAIPTPNQHPRKAEAMRLVAMAQSALAKGDVNQAARIVEQATALQVPNDAFNANETAPWQLSLKINGIINRRNYGVKPAAFEALPAVAKERPAKGRGYPVRPGVYDPTNDPTRNVPAQSVTPAQPLRGDLAASRGQQLFNAGMNALQNQDRDGALESFKEAWQFKDELDPNTLRQLREKLVLLNTANQPVPRDDGSPLEEVTSKQHLLRQKLSQEISGELAAAEKGMASDPKGALNRLQRVRSRVTESELDSPSQKQLLTVIDRGIRKIEAYLDQFRGEIELRERNDGIRNEIAQDRESKLQAQDKIGQLVDEFNKLVDEQRYAEAELIAKQVREIDPNLPVSQLVLWKSRFIRRIRETDLINEKKEAGFFDAIQSTVESSTPIDDRKPFQFGDRLDWEDLTRRRSRFLEQHQRRMLPEEVQIQKNLLKKVEVRFNQTPLAEVVQVLGDIAGVPVHVDQAGLAAEAVTSDTPVTINLSQPVTLRSALNLILEPLRLSYVIENEVLNVTSESARDTQVYTDVYNVADLVIPIPNFIPGYNVGLPAAIREAHRAIGYGGFSGFGGSPVPMTIAANEGNNAANGNASVLAQMSASGMLSSQGARPSQPSSVGPGGMGGAALADFDTLIDLITTTIAPQTWDDVGGPGAIESFPTNLSLVISQTQDVHEEIAELLDQLRRLQDLQITIEVRFITLNDEFFERIGVDFNFDIDDNSRLTNATPQFPDDISPSMTVGLDPTGAPTADLDLQFTQDSFTAAVPQFGNFDAATAANFGFAILSDIEVFFLLQAAQGNERANVLQAPKVTLYNGQSATVSDSSQRPFVTSIIPVVGDFAAAHQPVIVVLNEGTSLNVQAVVSNDRRFVRVTLVPFFSQIGEVDTFTFNGSTTTNTGSIDDDAKGNPTDAVNNATTTMSGSTVQLPTFSFTTVSTTVNVPDGGTVLLGGIKRLAEGRTERGVPVLAKLPYISRLFKNVGIGRTTQTLMLMVTPRIIIQEEEEAKLGIDLAN